MGGTIQKVKGPSIFLKKEGIDELEVCKYVLIFVSNP